MGHLEGLEGHSGASAQTPVLEIRQAENDLGISEENPYLTYGHGHSILESETKQGGVPLEENEHGAQDRSEGPWESSLMMAAVPKPEG